MSTIDSTLFVACTKYDTKGSTTDDNKRKVNATANDYTENGNRKHFIRLGLSAGDEPEKTSGQDYIYPDYPCLQIEHESARSTPTTVVHHLKLMYGDKQAAHAGIHNRAMEDVSLALLLHLEGCNHKKRIYYDDDNTCDHGAHHR